MRNKIVAIVAGLTTVGTFAVCASSQAFDDQTEQVASQSEGVATAVDTLAVPVYLTRNTARYENQPVADAGLEEAVHEKKWQLISECMAGKGLPLAAFPHKAEPAPRLNNELLGGKLDSNGVPATRRVYVNPGLAATQGYSLTSEEIAEERSRREALGASAGEGDQDHSGMALSRAQHDALYGSSEGTVRKAIGNGTTVTVSPASCTAQADRALFGDNARFASMEMKYVNRASLSIASLNSDPAYSQARKTYHTCMAKAGFKGMRSPGFGVNKALTMRIERGDAALEEERRLAQADVACEASAEFYKTKRAAEDRIFSSESAADQAKSAVGDYEAMLRQAVNK